VGCDEGVALETILVFFYYAGTACFARECFQKKF